MQINDHVSEGFADGFRWPHEAILLLLKYYKEQKHHMATGKMTQKKFCSMVASELSKKGYVVTGSQCKSKISGLRNTYKNIKAHRNERYRRTWHYYEVNIDNYRLYFFTSFFIFYLLYIFVLFCIY